MKTVISVLALLAISGCASDSPTEGRYYANNDLELAVGNGAFMSCTCAFVMEMSDEYCRAWVKATPDVARISVDREAKTAQSSAFLTWSAKARYVDAKRGCVLE